MNKKENKEKRNSKQGEEKETHKMVKGESKIKKNKKKTRRGKSINKKLRDNLDIYYINIRGIKSKIESLESILDERKPDIVGIVETMLDSKDEIQIKGYKTFRNDRDKDGGGVMVAVKKELGACYSGSKQNSNPGRKHLDFGRQQRKSQNRGSICTTRESNKKESNERNVQQDERRNK